MNNETKSRLVYLDTSIFAGMVLLSDEEDKKCALLIKKIANKEFENHQFITSKFTLIELAELITRKETKEKAKAVLFDLVYDPDLQIDLISPEPAHKTLYKREYFDIDLLIAHIVNTALEYSIPGFDTIHAHTVRKLNEKIIAISKDKDFHKFRGITNVSEVVKASDFLNEHS